MPNPRKPVEPLDRRETRVKLLLASYLDAVQQGRPDGEKIVGGKPGSRPPARGGLWYGGSYPAVEKALDTLRTERRKQHFHLYALLVTGNSDVRVRRQEAAKGFARLLELLPSSIYVPEEISEAAGYLPSEAKRFTWKQKVAA